jgi:hypothetical protein
MIKTSNSRQSTLACFAFRIALTLLPAIAGCGQGKESLHEMDHATPEHWPKDLADAVDKISQRLAIFKSDPGHAIARQQLRDLVNWVPEIAADTDIPEPHWIPIHRLSETLRNHLRADEVDVSDIEEDFSRLNQLLVAAHAKVALETAEQSSPTDSVNSN